jgi:hypothetical protein
MKNCPWPSSGGSVPEAQQLTIPAFHDDFLTSKPLWAASEAITSGDWQVNTGTGKLDGIAENNAADWITRAVEGDVDLQIKVERGTATSAGIYLDGNSVQARISRTATGLFITTTGEANATPAVGADTMWLRITWDATGDVDYWWKINDGDDWTLQQSYTGKNFGHDKEISLDSANGGHIQEIILYHNGQVIPTRSIAPVAIPLTDAATIAIDVSQGNFFFVTLGGNRTLGNPTNPAGDGQKIIVRVTQDGTGNRTLAFAANYRFSTDLPSPTISTGAGDIDYLGFVYHEADAKWDYVAEVFGF